MSVATPYGLLRLGCLLLLAAGTAAAHAPVTTTVQFDREIVHILDDHCVMCHMRGATAFPLVTYEQTYAARWKIRQSVLQRRMVPWAAVAGYGDFSNSNALTQREIDFLVSWAESFGPRNNGEVSTGTAVGTRARVIQARTDFLSWALGEPDARVPVAASARARTSSHEVLRVVLDPKLSRERWLRGLEFHPADRRAIHAVRFTVESSGDWLASWTPWQGFVRYPQGLSRRLAAGARIAADIDVYPDAAVADIRGSLGLYFSGRPSTAPMTDILLRPDPQSSSPGKWQAVGILDHDTSVYAIDPGGLAGLKSIQVLARSPDRSQAVLLFARDIPVEWPTPYLLRNPRLLPRGTTLSLIEHGTDPGASHGGQAVRLITFAAAAPPAQPDAAAPADVAPAKRFHLSGVVKSVDAAGGLMVVDQGDIPGFMGAMTMTYRVGPHENLDAVHPGDHIQSEVVVSNGTGRLEHIRVGP